MHFVELTRWLEWALTKPLVTPPKVDQSTRMGTSLESGPADKEYIFVLALYSWADDSIGSN